MKIIYKGDSVLIYPSDSLTRTTVNIITALPDGKYFGFLNNDTAKLRLIVNYENGKIHGEYLEYFGLLNSLSKSKYYINGIAHGDWIIYDPEAIDEILQLSTYEEGKKNGFEYLYGGRVGNRINYITHFYKNDTMVYSLGLPHDSIVYYNNGWSHKYFRYPIDKCDSSGGKMLDGKREGVWRSFYNNGNPKYIGEYKNDIKYGEWKEYYENGRLSEEYFCDLDKNGNVFFKQYSKFNDSGIKISAGNFINGVGKIIIKSSSGILSSEESYVKINCLEYQKYYTSSGLLIRETYYKNCKRDGIQKLYNHNGIISSLDTYKKGEPYGLSISYFENGKIQNIGVYKNVYGTLRYRLWRFFPQPKILRKSNTNRQLAQHKQGKWMEYDNSGKLLKMEYYKYGELNGKSIDYYENGKIKKEIRYKNGLLHGTIKEYSDQAILTHVSKYKWGRLIVE